MVLITLGTDYQLLDLGELVYHLQKTCCVSTRYYLDPTLIEQHWLPEFSAGNRYLAQLDNVSSSD
jgi:hypothetical protein